ncbi:uncharacterized protein LOC117769088 isoform X5 [Hippoglossus hippoglossus]|uniref:uncharacterized protein LOC117769088 isoform X5 n=1 Tax=Hippoglossus hippoglossus TaxID=8267 RepID=UPI00148E13D3|nr:uncharacterized protein LOC117769088 isoform X5 [Hippoglossus hippoglossus]
MKPALRSEKEKGQRRMSSMDKVFLILILVGGKTQDSEEDFSQSTIELNMSLFLTAAMCVAAILFVCLFTLCLLCAVKHQRSGPRQNRETSADYETMTPGEGTEPEPRCTCSPSDCAAPSAPPPPPPDLCPHFTSKHRESTVTLGEYAEVDVRGHVCQYQHLDLSQLEDHVYHRLCGPKDGPMQMNC